MRAVVASVIMIGLGYLIGRAFGADLNAEVPIPTAIAVIGGLVLVGWGLDRIVMRR